MKVFWPRSSVPYFKKTFNVKTIAVIYDAKDAVSTAISTKIPCRAS